MGFHPAGILCLWLGLVIGVQFAGVFVCVFLILLFLSTVHPLIFLKKWGKLLKRNLLLLLSLWLILAYQTPGDLWMDLPFAPTDQGILSAWLQTLRLFVIFAALVWLHEYFDFAQLSLALFTLLSPFSRCGIPTERFIARLLLVLENFRNPPQFSLKTWRKWMDDLPLNNKTEITVPEIALNKKDFLLFFPAFLWFFLLYYF